MSTLLAISPHLDDAIFSAGAELARRVRDGWRVVVATCFTGNVDRPHGFALACQLDKGLGPEVDYMALRRAEDAEACARIGAEFVHLPFLEAPHRGYDDAAALFAGPRPEPWLEAELAAALDELVASLAPAEIFAPAAIGNHVDHLLVRQSVQRVTGVAAKLWADLPYAARSGGPLAGFEPRACESYLTAKLEAAAHYRSQLAFQFRDAPAERLLAIDGAEWLKRTRPV